MNQNDRDMLIRIDERTKDLPEMKKKVDEIHAMKVSIRWLTWGVRGLYSALVGMLVWAISK
jgi:hypothetical protein